MLSTKDKEMEGENKNEGTVKSDGVGKENEDIAKEKKKKEEVKTILAYYPEHVIIGLSLGLIVCVCAFSYSIVCLCYVTFGNRPEPWPGQINNSTQDGNSSNQTLSPSSTIIDVKPKPRIVVIKQPTCNELLHFQEFIREVHRRLYHKYELCYPADIHNPLKHLVPSKEISSDTIGENKGYFVVYLAVSLLLASLGAAIVDLCKAKGQRPSKNKPPLTKRCSLADLTVLRHNRRESMRRDSLIDEHRVPHKLLGSKHLVYERRFSSPSNHASTSSSCQESFGDRISPRTSRKFSLDHYHLYDQDVYNHEFHRVRLIRR